MTLTMTLTQKPEFVLPLSRRQKPAPAALDFDRPLGRLQRAPHAQRARAIAERPRLPGRSAGHHANARQDVLAVLAGPFQRGLAIGHTSTSSGAAGSEVLRCPTLAHGWCARAAP